MRQRIFTASQAGDLAKVRKLQKLMLRSRSNTLVSVRRVTERNAGRLTAGVDGEVVLTPEAKIRLVDRIQRGAEPFTAWPVRRVYIPKAGGKRRPLGIPVILDRAHQARVVNALEPEWEARFEPRSYGFRPGRGCHDAIGAIYRTARGASPQRRWVLDADLAGAFDRIAHDHILTTLGSFPARAMIRQWLKAGVVEHGRLSPTEEGTPQGGVVSPVLLNVALHGMEQAAGVRYYTTSRAAGWTVANSPVLIRYADDLVALCHSRHEASRSRPGSPLAGAQGPGLQRGQDARRLPRRGLRLPRVQRPPQSGKLLIKPSKAAQRRIRKRLRTEMRSLRGTNARAVIKRLNPIIRGWAAYYRAVVSSEVFSALDAYLWKLAYKWARFTHPNKPTSWVVARYFGQFNTSRHDRWVFGDRDSGAYLHKFAWTRIVRHQMVKGAASPDDPALTDYWAKRRRKAPPLSIDTTSLRLLDAQHGRCHVCGDWLLPADRPATDPTRMGTMAARRPQSDHPRSPRERTARRTTPNPVSYTPTAAAGLKPTTATRPALLPAREPPGLA